MYLIYNPSTDPAFNLALEDYVLTELEGDFVLLWRNAKAVIIGKNQNTVEEVNMEYAQRNNISVNRRISGGGAVFHDLGNINYTVIKDRGKDDFSNYVEFTGPVIAFLKEKGVTAELSGRNDLTVNGMKISGNAQAAKKGRIMHHGTLLYDVSVGDLAGVLRPNQAKISSKGIKSIRSRVTNLIDHMPSKSSPEDFLKQLYDFYLNLGADVTPRELTDTDRESVMHLVKKQFGTWEWNVGSSPDYDYRQSIRYDFGIVDIRLSVGNGVIRNVSFYGDFFGLHDIQGLQRQLIGLPNDKVAIVNHFAGANLDQYISGMDSEQFALLFM